MKWVNGHIEVDKVTRPKKITGIRLAAVLGFNKWNTPFKTWCEMTHTYEEPFVDTKYTIAGKVIEPKQAAFVADNYFATILSPSDLYGEDYFQTTHGDFFPDNRIFGGMWDYLGLINGKAHAVYEMKTTKRIEDWEDDIPEYYAMQAALYAWLRGIDQVYMVCSVLTEKDYEHPEDYVPTDENTFVRGFLVSERYPDMDNIIRDAADWYRDHVLAGISPPYDEKKDADILKVLRRSSLNPDTDMEELLKEADELLEVIDAAEEAVKAKRDRLDVIIKIIKDYCTENWNPDYAELTLPGHRNTWTYARTRRTEVDKKALEADGLLDKYSKVTEGFRLTHKKGE